MGGWDGNAILNSRAYCYSFRILFDMITQVLGLRKEKAVQTATATAMATPATSKRSPARLADIGPQAFTFISASGGVSVRRAPSTPPHLRHAAPRTVPRPASVSIPGYGRSSPVWSNLLYDTDRPPPSPPSAAVHVSGAASETQTDVSAASKSETERLGQRELDAVETKEAKRRQVQEYFRAKYNNE